MDIPYFVNHKPFDFEGDYEDRFKNKEMHDIKYFGARPRLSWYYTALNLAFDIAKYRSQDPYTIVGACAIKKDGFEVVLGYNGAPSGKQINWSNREEKNELVIHAEANVLTRCKPGEIDFLAVTHLPCAHCLKTVAQYKINVVVYSIELPKYEPEKIKNLAQKLGISLIRLNPTTKNV